MGKKIYFLRHGESTANEKNCLAGTMDVELTELGKIQAAKSGADILKKRLVFDEVHVSTLKRAKVTGMIALDNSNQSHVTIVQSPALRERDFGVMSGKNKNMLRKFYGYEKYEKILHSPHAHPEKGESFTGMYERVKRYYYEVLVPLADSGKTILVVSHKYIIEMFAMVTAGLQPEEYFDFKLPNSKIMSEKELNQYIKKESKTHKEISDKTIYHSSLLIVGATILGIFIKPHIRIDFGMHFFLISVLVLLAINTFFTMLGLDTKQAKHFHTFTASDFIPLLMKFVPGIIIFFIVPVQFKLFPLLFVLPPSISSVSFSLLWGGEKHTALSKVIRLTVVSLVIFALLIFTSGAFTMIILLKFVITVVLIFIVSFAAQVLKFKKPISTGKFFEHWQFIGPLSMVLISFLSAYHFTPDNLFTLIAVPVNPQGYQFLIYGLISITSFVVLKGSAFFFSNIINEKMDVKTDIYISHGTPNIFLWVSILSGMHFTRLIGFWAMLFFFLLIYVDEFHLFNLFKRKMKLAACRT